MFYEITIFRLFFLLCFLFSCTTKTDDDFISKYDGADFKKFSQTLFINRGRKDTGDIVVFFEKNELCPYSCLLTIEEDFYNIKEYQCNTGNYCSVDSVMIDSLVREFLYLDIGYLKVNIDYRVYINVDGYETYDLMWIPDSMKILLIEKYDLVPVKNSWFKVK